MPLPPQALRQIAAAAATAGVQSSGPIYQNGQDKVQSSTHEGQHGSTNVWSMTNTPESQTSISDIKRISPSPPPYVQLPSPPPTEQASQRKTSAPKTPLPTAIPSTIPSGPRKSTRTDTGAIKSSHHQLGPAKPAPQKRLHVEINADGDTMKGTRTTKRPKLMAVPREQAAKPTELEALREIPSDGCSACGFQAEHLLQLTEMAWRWIPKDNASFEALLKSDFSFSDAEKSVIMLRICLGSTRDYAWEMAAIQRQPGHPLQPTMTLSEYTETEQVSGQSDSLSDTNNDDDRDSLSKGTESDGDSVTEGVGSKRQVCGRGPRWSPLEEQRLRSYIMEKKDWPWIAVRLGRTEGAVKQHWGKMS